LDKKVIEYILVAKSHNADMVTVVNGLIEDGYQPIGGTSVAKDHQIVYSQALVKYGEDKPKATRAKRS
jgi:aspartyl-tRNA synthetase